jgi:large subunit ribosomal protein L9
MKVILTEKVVNLGGLGSIVNVKPGYARNFLIPQGKAKSATEANLAAFEARRAELEKAAAQALSEAQSMAEKMNGLSVTIAHAAGDEGKLFGSVGTVDIAKALNANGFAVERKQVRLPEGALRATGEYDVEINLHTDVDVSIKLSIVAE